MLLPLVQTRRANRRHLGAHTHRDIVRVSLDTVSDWRLTRPADVPGQSIGQADYVLIAEIVEVERFEQQASEHVQRLTDDLAHLVSSRGMLIVRPVL